MSSAKALKKAVSVEFCGAISVPQAEGGGRSVSLMQVVQSLSGKKMRAELLSIMSEHSHQLATKLDDFLHTNMGETLARARPLHPTPHRGGLHKPNARAPQIELAAKWDARFPLAADEDDE